MNLPERKEARARRLLETVPSPPVPVGLAGRALRRGRRIARRRRRLRRAGWFALGVAVAVFAVWAVVARPWVEPPTVTTPPLQYW